MIVLCTGCRTGFGKLIALSAARVGHTVYAGVRDPSAAPELVEESRGYRIVPIALDVTDAAQRADVVARIVREHGRLDALVNNAGLALAGFQEHVSAEELRRLFEVNVFAVHALTKLCLPHLRESRGIVINVSSMAARQPMPGMGAYAASKFALEGMTEVLRHEVRPFGVRVVLVEPGPYRTEIFAENRWTARETAEAPGPYAAFRDRMQALLAKAESKMGDAQDVADLVVRLLATEHPRLRYPLGPGTSARLLARRTVPFEVMERVIARIIGV